MTSVLLPSRTPRRAVPSMLLVLATALMLALTLTPPPAHAHDTLIATDPEDGATLETSPEEITLTFSANILDVSSVARISDEDGELLSELTPPGRRPRHPARQRPRGRGHARDLSRGDHAHVLGEDPGCEPGGADLR